MNSALAPSFPYYPPPARPVRSQDIAPLVNVLVRAFDDDPSIRWIVRDDAGRREAMRRFFLMMLLDVTMPHGEVLTEDGLRGVALWTPPGRWKARWYDHLAHLPTWLAVIGWRRFAEVVAATNAIAAHHPKAPHYYLFSIGVDPEHQGRGIGGALMRPVLAKCDVDGVLAYLEASKPDNIPVYERLGFEVQGEIRLGKNGPPIFPMLRRPRG
jgi:ribosomal protein S18 acetylase RimI-like enzyme